MAVSQMHDKVFPGESSEYREARTQLLREEIALRQKIEDVAALRRNLPLGGLIQEDYVFEEYVDGKTQQTKLSELFEGDKSTLIVYSLMYGSSWEAPCRMCNGILDGLNGNIPHLTQQVNFAVVAKALVQKLNDWSNGRDWNHMRLLSSQNNNYNVDYHTQTGDDDQWPICNVFAKTDDGIRHFYASELFFAPVEGHPRHMDLAWPLWNLLDLTPEGRGQDWMPDFSY
jgi:predicted dithiol-disulfide oxidoreductase (DUF899 family)